MSLWTLRRIAQALGGSSTDERPISAIITDSRTITAGCCFVALRGERFDAHDFLADAVAAGATALIVSDPSRTVGLGVPVFTVPDTLHALGRLARYHRDLWGGTVVAVGGSNGKTSTKELLRAALGAQFQVHATTGNLNNQIGVPMTLLGIADGTAVAVVEAGTNYPGEIALLREIIRPDVAVLTSVQEEHLEGLGDLAGVMREELALVQGVPVAIVPRAQPEIGVEARPRAGAVIEAGLDGENGDGWGLHPDGRGWFLHRGVRIEVPLRGAHNLRNAALAMAVAEYLGVPVETAAAGIAAMPQPSMRSAVEPLGRALLLNDAYNANPGSARAALELLRDLGRGRQRVAVLGTMRELGSHAERAHREVAQEALDAGIELVCGIGEFEPALAGISPAAGRVLVASDVEELWPLLEPRLAPDAAILLKASRGVRLERLLPHLTAWASA